MTWDWDKLQEKRQRQQGQRPSRPLFGDDDIYFQGLYGYEKSWKAMKEKYGEHFKD